MRKFIATLIVAVILGTGFTMTADAAHPKTDSQQVQIVKLQKQVKNLRADRNFWEDEANSLSNQLAAEQNKPVFPAFTGAAHQGNGTVVYRVTWDQTFQGITYSWVSDPLYTTDQRDVVVQQTTADPTTVPGSVKTETASIGTFS